MVGSLKVSLLAMFLSKESRREGSNKRLDNMAKSNVVETSAPNATVPPKLDMVKVINPKNNTMEV